MLGFKYLSISTDLGLGFGVMENLTLSAENIWFFNYVKNLKNAKPLQKNSADNDLFILRITIWFIFL